MFSYLPSEPGTCLVLGPYTGPGPMRWIEKPGRFCVVNTAGDVVSDHRTAGDAAGAIETLQKES